MSSTELVTGPDTGSPVLSLQELKDHLRVPSTETNDDAYIEGLLQAAVEIAEATTNRKLITQTWDYFSECFPWGRTLELPYPKLQSVTTVKYKDSNGALQTWNSSNYLVKSRNICGSIELAPGIYNWPVVQIDGIEMVQIRFVCGYATPAEVPQSIKQAILMMVGHWYENREDVVVGTIVATVPQASLFLLYPFRVFKFA